MRVLVCGGREFGKLNRLPDGNPNLHDEKADEYKFIMTKLYKFADENSSFYNPDDNWLPNDIEIISGKATGVDTVAIDWAVVNWCKCHEFPADWKKHGRRAGFIRNQQMLDEGKPDVVLAFPGGNGTAMMKRIAREAGIPVIEYAYNTDS